MKHIEETNLKLESEEQLKNCEDMHIWVQPIKEYIKKLEVKEERAKKVEELLGLKNREIKLLKARLFYNDNDELDDIKYLENSTALFEVREQIKALEEELK